MALVEYWALTSNSLVGSVLGTTLTAVNFAYDASGTDGPAWHSTSDSAGYLYTEALALSQPFTILVRCYVPGGGGGSDRFFAGYVLGGNNHHIVWRKATSIVVGARSRAGGTAGDAEDATTTTSDTSHDLAGVFASTTSRSRYINSSVVTNTTSVSPSGASTRFCIGGLWDGTVLQYGVPTTWYFKHAAIYNTALSEAEIGAYWASPGGGGGGGFAYSHRRKFFLPRYLNQ